MDFGALHIAWVAAGFDPARFWDISLAEADREMGGAIKRREREANERMSQSWHTVALDRTKNLPKLETLIVKSDQPRRKKSPEEMLLAMKSIFLAFGGDPSDLKDTP